MEIDIMPPDSGKAIMDDYRLSKQVADVLCEHYPGYAWLVRVQSESGVCLIKCAQINSVLSESMTPSMVLHLKNMTDPTITRRKVIMAGGELLERAAMIRGRWRGELPTHVDGLSKVICHGR